MSSVLGTLASPAAAAAQLLPILADSALKGVVIFGIAACAVALCRRRSAATRHAIWAGAVVAQLTLPVLSALLPAWRVPVADRLARRFAAVPGAAVIARDGENMLVLQGGRGGDDARIVMPVRVRGEFGGADIASVVTIGGGNSRPTIVSVGGQPFVRRSAPFMSTRLLRTFRHRGVSWWLRFAAVVWLVGAIAILVRFLAGTIAVSRLAKRSERVEDGHWLSLAQRIAIRLGVARPLTLLRSGRFGIPVTWGVVYPVVLLPDDADEWTDARRRYVLVHEMAHVKRVDAFTQLMAQVAIAAFWFDPLVWIAAHRMRVEREHACDDYVLREGTPASTYAADLLAMVRALGARGRAAQPAFAALAMARPAELEGRVHAILDPGQDRATLRSAPALALALCSLMLLVPLAAFRPFGSRRPARAFAGITVPTPSMMAMEMPEMAEAPEMPEMPEIPQMPEIPDIPVMPASSPELAAHLRAALSGASAAIRTVGVARAASAALVSTIASSASAAATGSAAALAMTPSASRVSSASCSSISLRRTGTSTSMHSNQDDDNRSYQYISSSAGRCLQLAVWGQIEFTPDERGIDHLSRNGRLYVRERRDDVDREVEVTADGDENPRYAYRVNNEPAAFDDEARGWFADLLPGMLRESGLNAPARVARLHRDGGIDAVLADIAETQSTSAKRAEYEALLKGSHLSDGEIEQVMQQAGEDLASSDSELRAVLAQMGRKMHSSPPMAEAFGKAVEHMSSDDEKRALLEQYISNGDRDMLLVAMRQAKSIGSDDEKGALLRSTVAHYLNCDDEELHSAFFSTARTIGSDEEKRAVLAAALPYAKQRGVLMNVLDAAKDIGSDEEKAELLIGIARQGLAATGPLHDAFLRVTKSISSDSEYRRVVEVAFAR
jgi:BlaR1 peptidase M56